LEWAKNLSNQNKGQTGIGAMVVASQSVCEEIKKKKSKHILFKEEEN
jgi:hypothetical protein